MARKDFIRVYRHCIVYLLQQRDIIMGVTVEAASIQGLIVLLQPSLKPLYLALLVAGFSLHLSSVTPINDFRLGGDQVFYTKALGDGCGNK